MSAMMILIGASLLVAVGFLGAFLWAVNNGQFKDRYTPSIRMLLDDDKPDDKETTRDNPS
jgi:cbb3-type cytochrome oxidase maturation protein